jgi:hypothetical protein
MKPHLVISASLNDQMRLHPKSVVCHTLGFVIISQLKVSAFTKWSLSEAASGHFGFAQ